MTAAHPLVPEQRAVAPRDLGWLLATWQEQGVA